MTLAARLLLVVLVTTLGGCAHPPSFLQPIPLRDFRAALGDARAAADSGRWATADQILADYIRRHPGTDEAHEALYWRALFRLAPSNDTTAHRLAIPTLEQYLAGDEAELRSEARILLEHARAHDALRREAAAKEQEIAEVRAALGRARERQASPDAPPAAEPPAADRGLAEEVERLKAELARANQELERIRRRLARQTP